MTKIGQLVADRWYGNDRLDLLNFAVVFQSEAKELFADTLLVDHLIRHGYGGVVQGCEYHVIPGLVVRANLRFARECQLALEARSKPEARATRP